MNNELVKRVEDKILDTMLIAEKIFNRSFELPALSFDLNSGRIAGQAFCYRWLIKINPKFLSLDSDHVINVTVPHEVAHLICHKMYPHAKQHHGPDWRSIMIRFGLRPNTYHTMRLPESMPHTYICSCQKFHLSNLLHKRMQNGSRRICNKCRKELVYLNSI
jgi:SprT protein